MKTVTDPTRAVAAARAQAVCLRQVAGRLRHEQKGGFWFGTFL